MASVSQNIVLDLEASAMDRIMGTGKNKTALSPGRL